MDYTSNNTIHLKNKIIFLDSTASDFNPYRYHFFTILVIPTNNSSKSDDTHKITLYCKR